LFSLPNPMPKKKEVSGIEPTHEEEGMFGKIYI